MVLDQQNVPLAKRCEPKLKVINLHPLVVYLTLVIGILSVWMMILI